MGLTWKRNGLGYLGMETSHSLNSVLNVGEYASDKMEAISWLPPRAITVVEVVLDWFLEYSPPEVLDLAPTLENNVLYSISISTANSFLLETSIASMNFRI